MEHKDSHKSHNSNKEYAVNPQYEDPLLNSKYIIVGGSSVMGLKYKDGVILAADTLGSYGSMKRYKDFLRFYKINDSCVIGASGDLSDFQEVITNLQKLQAYDNSMEDDIVISPTRVANYLQKLLYDKRSKMDLFLNNIVVAGTENGKPYLAQVNMIGIQFTCDYAATGFARYFAVPQFYKHHKDDMSEEDAVKLLQDGLKLCTYRDKQMINRFIICKVTYEGGVTYSEPFSVDLDWSYEGFKNPQILAPGVW